MREPRPLVYDATHLVSRLCGATATGIDWVDRAHARHLTERGRLACGLHYGLRRPHVLDPGFVAELSRFHRRKFDNGGGRPWSDVRNWLVDSEPEHGERPMGQSRGSLLAELGLTLRARLRDDHRTIPEGAIYLNIAQHGFEYPHFFSWLDRRPDVIPVFLVHDLLPLDYPEFFRDGYETLFRARVETILRRAGAIIATTPCTAERIAKEFRARGRPVPPLHAEPLASPLEEAATGDLSDAQLAGSPYFVAIATIEPRKNHVLLLNLWRDLARREPRPPKLVLVGGRGLGSAEILDGLARSKSLAQHVRHVSGLSSDALRRLLVHARALLAPSFAEGYGMPLVEALQLGTPVVCSDIAVFREVTQGCARFVSPLDGVGWRTAVLDLASPTSPARASALETTARFQSPNWGGYFAHVEEFLSRL